MFIDPQYLASYKPKRAVLLITAKLCVDSHCLVPFSALNEAVWMQHKCFDVRGELLGAEERYVDISDGSSGTTVQVCKRGGGKVVWNAKQGKQKQKKRAR